MNIEIIEGVALVHSEEVRIKDARTALETMMELSYNHGVSRIAINKEALDPRFFVLSSGIAGEVLERFIVYKMKFAIYGDFSGYTSKPLKDFIYESNNGRDIFFVATAEEAVDRLLGAR